MNPHLACKTFTETVPLALASYFGYLERSPHVLFYLEKTTITVWLREAGALLYYILLKNNQCLLLMLAAHH